MSVSIDPALLVALAGGQPDPLPSCVSRVEVQTLGDLWLPTGRVVASDPVVFCETTFARRAPVGLFAVRVVVAHFTHPAAEPTVAGVCIEFAPATPERWEMALLPGEDLTALPAGSMLGYGVDRAHQLVSLTTRSDYDWPCPRPYGMAELGGGLNIAVFRSGIGDGCYASYWGLRGGEPVCLITDFRLLASWVCKCTPN